MPSATGQTRCRRGRDSIESHNRLLDRCDRDTVSRTSSAYLAGLALLQVGHGGGGLGISLRCSWRQRHAECNLQECMRLRYSRQEMREANSWCVTHLPKHGHQCSSKGVKCTVIKSTQRHPFMQSRLTSSSSSSARSAEDERLTRACGAAQPPTPAARNNAAKAHRRVS